MGGTLSRSDVVIKKGGIHTLRAVVTDEASQVSTNACTAQVDVKGGFPIFVGGYFGKERLTHDDVADHDDIIPFARLLALRPARRPRGRLPADDQRQRAVRGGGRRQVPASTTTRTPRCSPTRPSTACSTAASSAAA